MLLTAGEFLSCPNFSTVWLILSSNNTNILIKREILIIFKLDSFGALTPFTNRVSVKIDILMDKIIQNSEDCI